MIDERRKIEEDSKGNKVGQNKAKNPNEGAEGKNDGGSSSGGFCVWQWLKVYWGALAVLPKLSAMKLISSRTFINVDMVEKEAKRLEVMKRRQERELSQLIQYEMVRKEMQEKAEAKVRIVVSGVRYRA